VGRNRRVQVRDRVVEVQHRLFGGGGSKPAWEVRNSSRGTEYPTRRQTGTWKVQKQTRAKKRTGGQNCIMRRVSECRRSLCSAAGQPLRRPARVSSLCAWAQTCSRLSHLEPLPAREPDRDGGLGQRVVHHGCLTTVGSFTCTRLRGHFCAHKISKYLNI
jgi:hypothetical protein